jgi:hypothetical protein
LGSLPVSRSQRRTPGGASRTDLVGELEDPARLAELAARSDVLTFDWENISGKALAPLEADAIRPPGRRSKCRRIGLLEKALFSKPQDSGCRARRGRQPGAICAGGPQRSGFPACSRRGAGL